MATPLEQVCSTYDTDYNLWVLETVKQLEKRDFDSPIPPEYWSPIGQRLN